MADILETIKQLIREGASSDEIVDTLKTMGISEDEARKLILLAERDMLRVLRNEIREIAKDAFDERAEVMKKDVLADIHKAVDTRLKLAQKTLTDMVRSELNQYVNTLSHTEERVALLERRVFDLEERVAKLESARPVGRRRTSFLRYLFPLIGVGSVIAALFMLGSDKALAGALFFFGIIIFVGGILLG